MCIPSISAMCSWICCTDIPDDHEELPTRVPTMAEFSKSTLVSIEERDEDIFGKKLYLAIEDALNCPIEFENDPKTRHHHPSTTQLQVPTLPD